jgi:hypothetical protein
MSKEYIIHGHGVVQYPNGRIIEPFHAGESVITFYTNFGSCLTVDRNKLSVSSASVDAKDYYITKASNLSRRAIESRIGIPLFTQKGWVTDLWMDISPSNLQMAGLYEVNKKTGLFKTVHMTRHKQSYVLLSSIVRKFGPAHFHVLSCRAAPEPISHENSDILAFALNKNKFSTSRRPKQFKSNTNKNIPVSLSQLQTRKRRYFKRKKQQF